MSKMNMTGMNQASGVLMNLASGTSMSPRILAHADADGEPSAAGT